MREIDERMYRAWATTAAYRRHVETARRILREAAAKGPVAVSVSWGKDSNALAHLALETLGRLPLMHLASPYALPGYDETVAYFRERGDLHWVEATRTLEEYIEWCREIGLPHERTRADHQRVVKTIKRDRGAEWSREHGIAVMALGMRIDEKGPRATLLRKRGPLYAMIDGTWRACPLAYWTCRDVWAYVVEHAIPYNRRVYDAETHGLTRDTIRNTGWLSTDGAERGRIAWLRRHFPEQYAALVEAFPQVRICDGS